MGVMEMLVLGLYPFLGACAEFFIFNKERRKKVDNGFSYSLAMLALMRGVAEGFIIALVVCVGGSWGQILFVEGNYFGGYTIAFLIAASTLFLVWIFVHLPRRC